MFKKSFVGDLPVGLDMADGFAAPPTRPTEVEGNQNVK